MPTTGSSPKRVESFGYAAGSASLRRWSTLWHVAEGSASAVIAAPDGAGPLLQPHQMALGPCCCCHTEWGRALAFVAAPNRAGPLLPGRTKWDWACATAPTPNGAGPLRCSYTKWGRAPTAVAAPNRAAPVPLRPHQLGLCLCYCCHTKW